MHSITQSKALTLMLFALAALVLLAATPAHALIDVTACGQNLSTAGGQYVLTADLDCSGTFASAIDITANDVVLHLAGHTLASSDCDPNKGIGGIVVHGASGVKIVGGTVRGFNDGIVLGATNSRVSGVTVTNACTFGVAVSGAGNQVDISVVTFSGLDGIGIGAGSGTHIVGNDISDNVRVGGDISNFSNNNFVENNIINRNGIAAHEQAASPSSTVPET